VTEKKRQPKPLDLHGMLDLHIKASKRVRDLLEECQALRDAGKKAAARKVLARAEKIQGILRALEAEVKAR